MANLKKNIEMSSNTLKFIAIFFMTIAHFTFIFLSEETSSFIVLMMVGQIAAPIMFYLAVEGYHHTKSIKKYVMRLLIFAVISQPFFGYGLSGGVWISANILQQYLFYINVLFTIAFGLLAVYIRREIRNVFIKIFLILVLFFLAGFADWGAFGLISILLFDWFYGNFKKQFIAYCILILLMRLASFIQTGFDVPDFYFILELLREFVPITMLYFYNEKIGQGGKFVKWFFYIFYPLHLFVLGFVYSFLSN